MVPYKKRKHKSQCYPNAAVYGNRSGLGEHCLIGRVVVCKLHVKFFLEVGIAFMFEEDCFEDNHCLYELYDDRLKGRA